MHKHEWAYPVTGLLITCICLSFVSVVVKTQQYNPSVKEYKLRNY